MKKIYLVIFGVLLILVSTGFSWYFLISRKPSLRLELRSQVPNVKLAWRDKAMLKQIFQEQLTVAQTSLSLHPDIKQNVDAVRRVVVRLVPNEQPLFITYAGTAETGEHIASGNFTFFDDTLTLEVYIKDVKTMLTPTIPGIKERASLFTDAQFNEKMIKIFLFAVPPPLPSVQPEEVLLFAPSWSIAQVYDEIVKQYMMKDTTNTTEVQYPVRLVVQ